MEEREEDGDDVQQMNKLSPPFKGRRSLGKPGKQKDKEESLTLPP